MKTNYKFRFDKNFNQKVLYDTNLKLVSRNDLWVVVSGSFYDVLQLKNYPFIKDISEVRNVS